MPGQRDPVDPPAGPRAVPRDDGAHASAEQLGDLLDGGLPDEKAGAVAAHVAGCARCAAVQDQLAAVPALLAATSVPAMPPQVALRLDAAISAESARRATKRAPAGTDVVVSLHRLRRDRARHWFAGAATAAAVLVAFTVVPDLVSGSGSADLSAAGSAGESSADTQSDTQSDTGAAPSEVAGRAADVPDLDAADFADGVELLHDSGAAAFGALEATSPQDATSQRIDGAFSFLAPDAACTAEALAAARVSGAPGPLVRVDGELARLVASGPTRRRSVEAYSCDSGALLADARVDLTR